MDKVWISDAELGLTSDQMSIEDGWEPKTQSRFNSAIEAICRFMFYSHYTEFTVKAQRITFAVSIRSILSNLYAIGLIIWGALSPINSNSLIFAAVFLAFSIVIQINNWRSIVLPSILRGWGVIWPLQAYTFYLYPLPGRWHPNNLPYEHMFAAIFLVIGFTAFRSARDPIRNIIVIDFLWIQGLLHGASMYYDAMREGTYQHVTGDALIHVLSAFLFLQLRPEVPYYPKRVDTKPRKAKEQCCCCSSWSVVLNWIEVLVFLAIGAGAFVLAFVLLTEENNNF